MSYPSPPGPQDPRPQDQSGQNPGWQQPSYQPQGGNWAAPPYGGPPHKNRAGLIIVLIVVLVVAILGIGGFLAFQLTSGDDDGGTAPAAPPPSTGKVTMRPKTVPSVAPSKVPTKTVPSKPVTSQPAVGTKAAAFALAGRFAAQLNGDHTDAAVAVSCADTKSMMPTLISVFIGAPTKLAVSEPVVGQDPYVVPFTGTTNGHKVSGTIIIQGPCVKLFQLTES